MTRPSAPQPLQSGIDVPSQAAGPAGGVDVSTADDMRPTPQMDDVQARVLQWLELPGEENDLLQMFESWPGHAQIEHVNQAEKSSSSHGGE